MPERFGERNVAAAKNVERSSTALGHGFAHDARQYEWAEPATAISAGLDKRDRPVVPHSKAVRSDFYDPHAFRPAAIATPPPPALARRRIEPAGSFEKHGFQLHGDPATYRIVEGD